MGHIHVDSQLPGPVHEGNAQADWLTHLTLCSIQEATKDHVLHHQNAIPLPLQFHIPYETAHSTEIPYNPQGQTIVQHFHRVLKSQFHKLQQGEYKYSPFHILNHAVLIILI